AQCSFLYLYTIRQLCADRRQRRLQPDARVRRAADDLQRRILADRDLADAQLVGIRMRLARDDLADHHAVEPRAEGLDRLDFESGHGQAPAQLVAAGGWIDEFT